jgi:hypothetical protein
MLSVNDITTWSNDKVAPLIPGMKTYGIAKAAVKGDNIAPYIDGKHLEIYAGIDDTYSAQMYHKQLSISSTTVSRSGYGDNEQSLQNTYQMALIVFYNEKNTGIPADQLYTFIQSIITGVLKAEGYKSVRVGVSSAILNDGQVWAQEYGQTPFKLSGPQRLIQINYSIVMVFDKHCITIPNCKN